MSVLYKQSNIWNCLWRKQLISSKTTRLQNRKSAINKLVHEQHDVWINASAYIIVESERCTKLCLLFSALLLAESKELNICHIATQVRFQSNYFKFWVLAENMESYLTGSCCLHSTHIRLYQAILHKTNTKIYKHRLKYFR